MSGFRPKKCEQAYIKAGVYGPTGSGKSFSTLLFAEGLANAMGKRIAFVDTEHGTDFYAQDAPHRTAHPKAFDFDALDTRSLTEALTELQKLDLNKYGVLVIDSVTHFWEGAINAYEGRKTSQGGIPMYAWGKIKKPYKELINFLLNANAHVFILGREGNEFQKSEDSEELEIVGKKMKAEGETPYEPHILLRMEPLKRKDKAVEYRIYAEKDRTGVIAGQMISNPTFDNVIKPLLPMLGGVQAQIADPDETAAQDAIAMSDQDRAKAKISENMRAEYCARFMLAKTVKDLEAISKELTPATKKLLSPADVATLRESYLERLETLKKTD